MRRAVECRFTAWARMLFMNRENVLNLRSFWQVQIIGWCCFYLFDLLESIHKFLTKRVYIDEETVPIVFMFLGSFALRPFCRWLLRQSQSWIAFELKAAAAAMVTSIPVACAAGLAFAELLSCALARCGRSLGVVVFHSLHVVQFVFQHQAMAAIEHGEGAVASRRV